MAAPLEAAQQVKKPQSRAKRAGVQDVKSGEPPVGGQAGSPWGRKRFWLLLALISVLAAGLLIAREIWPRVVSGDGSAADRRWKTVLDKRSPCYAHLVSPSRARPLHPQPQTPNSGWGGAGV